MGAAPNSSGCAAGGVRPRKVLVVDDERDLADLAQALLSSYGIEAGTAYGAAEALQVMANDRAIDAVFTDVMMPGMTGLQLADEVRRVYPSVRIVLTSGFMAPNLMTGRHDYPFAAKPYRIEAVIELLRS